MKKEILSYLTGVINSYTSTIAVLTTNEGFSTSLNTLVAIKGEFESLLDIVMDIPEDKGQAITNFNKALKNNDLKKKVLELEETNENMNDNEKRMNEKLKAYECNDLVWKNVYEDLKAENRRLINGTLDKKHERRIKMKNFKCKVTRVDEYEIEVDETKITEEWMKNFRSYMYNFIDIEDHVEHLAQLRARQGEGFYEGYGYVSVNGERPFAVSLSEENESSYEDGINIKVIDEDDDIEVELEEIC